MVRVRAPRSRVFSSKANELVTKLRSETKRSGPITVEIVSWTSRSALDVIGVAAWGKDFGAILQPDSPFLKSYSGMFDLSGGGQLMNALALALPMKMVVQIPCAYNNRLKDALNAIRSRCIAVVREKKQKLASAAAKTHDTDILSLLIRGGVTDEQDLTDQMMTMLAAGHDTSSLTLAWACNFLCRHIDVQRRLRQELQSKLPNSHNDAQEQSFPEALDKLPFLNAVANETLRLMPAVPITRRETLKATQVQGYNIPQGGHLVASGYLANRLKTEWGADAEEFVPDRWLVPAPAASDKPEKSAVHNKFAFHSFSHGPRSCIGQGFARAEFLVFLAALVAAFHMELEDAQKETVPLFGITMSPAGGIRIKLTPVDGRSSL